MNGETILRESGDMKVTVGHIATAHLQIPVNVIYKCSKCGAENIDTTQVITMSQSVNGALWANQAELKNQANQNLQSEVKQLIDDMNQRDYRKLKLSCQCKSCGNKELWTKYFPTDSVARLFLQLFSKNSFTASLGIVAVVGLMILFNRIPILAGLIFAAIIAPFVYGAIRNTVIQNKISDMDDHNLPHIMIQSSQKD